MRGTMDGVGERSEVRNERGAPPAGAARSPPHTPTAACRGTTRGSTWSDHGVRATSEAANSRESEAALGD